MIYDVRHRTTYTYESAVSFGRCVLCLSPQRSDTQTVIESSLSVEPTPASQQARIGPFGEPKLTVVLNTPHRELVIEARSRIDVHGRDAPTASPPWEHVREQALASSDMTPNGPAAYFYPTRRTPVVDDITEYARTCFSPGRPVLEAAVELMGRIHADFKYDSKATNVSTPPQEAFAARHGVCQDFAHIMISAMKGVGLPAAYVSGYLRTTPPPGRPRLEGADATHAWAAAWCGEEIGWIGLDPTNDLIVKNDHIVLARGRDYSDVAPIDGIILAPGVQKLKVEVDVIPEDEILAARASQRARAAWVRG